MSRLNLDPTFANNVAIRQDVNFGIDNVLNFDGAFNRLPPASSISKAVVWSLGFNVGPDMGTEGCPRICHPSRFSGGSDAARWRDARAIDFVAGLERNWSMNITGREYSLWRVGLVFKTEWSF